ncbi:glycosyltransferase family 2 protein, partial [Piromyces sp. E2]
GDGASGKTEIFKAIANHLCHLTRETKKKTITQSAILKINKILGSFGTAQTLINPSSSRFGKYIEYQFDRTGKMIGVKLMHYCLEKSRVSKVPDDERNFNIFYHLLASATSTEKNNLNLSNPSSFYYLSQNSLYKRTTNDDTLDGRELRTALKAFGIGSRQQAQVFQLLAAILHLGNISFVDKPKNVQEPCKIKNPDQVEFIADLLGVTTEALETTLTYQAKCINSDVFTELLNANDACKQRDRLANTLYSLLFNWIIERINNKLCVDDDTDNFIGVVDLFGFHNNKSNQFEQFIQNYTCEYLQYHANCSIFEKPIHEFQEDGLSMESPIFSNNRSNMDILSQMVGVMDSVGGDSDATDLSLLSRLNSEFSSNYSYTKLNNGFGISHFQKQVTYDVKDFIEKNSDNVSSEFIILVRGSKRNKASTNMFLRSLFSEKAIATTRPMRSNTYLSGRASLPKRMPSVKRSKKSIDQGNNGSNPNECKTVALQLNKSLDTLLDTLSETMSWFVYCLRPNDDFVSDRFESDLILDQIRRFGIKDIVSKAKLNNTIKSCDMDEFCNFYEDLIKELQITSSTPQEKCQDLCKLFNFDMNEMIIGNHKVFISEYVWRFFEAERIHQKPREENDDERDRFIDEDEESLNESVAPQDDELADSKESMVYSSKDDIDGNSETEVADPENDGAPKMNMKKPIVASKELTNARKWWLCYARTSTFCCCDCCLSTCGKMKRADVQIAWREKVAINVIIYVLCILTIFYIMALGRIVCPSKKEWSYGQLYGMEYEGEKMRVSAYGKVFKFGDKYDAHETYSNGRFYKNFHGKDLSYKFNIHDSAYWDTMCPGLTRPQSSFDNLSTGLIKWFKNNKVGEITIVNTKEAIKRTLSEWGYQGDDPFYVIVYERIYDLTGYMGDEFGTSGVYVDQRFLIPEQKNIFESYKGEDMSEIFDRYKTLVGPQKWAQTIKCMDNLFFIGTVDHRNDFKCQITNYMMLGASMVIASILIVKFLAALQFGSKRQPEEHDKFVICQVPCYTEGEDSISKTVDSLAYLEYDDKRKLIFIISDGMIIGSGNDRPTPRIVLDHMGIDPEIDPEALWYNSIGTGTNQVNMAKVYSGLYEYEGHPVPFIVVVKVGTHRETSRPGNRGKRDSQMILMRYLHNVHHNYPMTPLELELYHQMKNVIGVDPSFYEYILMVDADTVVLEDSLNMLISSMVRDSRIMGICGETQLDNEKDTWVTMIQVYEYFISHHLSKAFESLFGSVTCLPGCFCMYRIRTPVKGTPVLITKGIIEDYSECIVDTLHKKNLLSLGEDRYLTTLMLKHFPQLKITFIRDAKCLTNAPETWAVLLSQRRRWINSTVHNLVELLFLNDLCGFMCFSMRFVVLIDLFSTMVQPAMIVYLFYLIFCIIFPEEDSVFPWVSLAMLAFTYGLQIIIFILRGAFQHIGWIVIYILAMPIFSMFIPLYSFWHFDDFSWGNTRRILGENGKVKLTGDEESDDLIEDIPTKLWSEYEKELNDALIEAEKNGNSSDSNTYRNSLGPTEMMSAYDPTQYGGGLNPYAGSVVNAPTYAGSAYAGSAYVGSVVDGPTYGYPMQGASEVNGSSEWLLAHNNRDSMAMSSEVDESFNISDEMIMAEVRKIIDNSDLMCITKKKVREEVSEHFGVDLSRRRDFINHCIEMALEER